MLYGKYGVRFLRKVGYALGEEVVAREWPHLSYFPHLLGTLAAPRSSGNTCCVFATEQWDTWKESVRLSHAFSNTHIPGDLEILVNRTLASEDGRSWSFIS